MLTFCPIYLKPNNNNNNDSVVILKNELRFVFSFVSVFSPPSE